MATVKVKLRPSTVEGKAGVIFYQITHNRKTRHITTRIRIFPSHWNANEEKLTQNATEHSLLQNMINSDVALLQTVIADLEDHKTIYTVEDIINRYNSPQCHILVLDDMRTLIEQLRTSNRLGTATNYEKTMISFGKFIGDTKLSLASLPEQVIIDYNAFLIHCGLVRNSVSFYMRILRAIYNKAVQQRLIEQQHPFTGVYTGIDKTRKRAVSEVVIAQLHRLKLPTGSSLALSRDMFIFSYCTCGMAFVDIAYLTKSDLHNGAICYIRRKTRQLLSVRIEPVIKQIIDRYATTESPYIFPIISSLDVATAYEQYRIALNNHNRLLGILSDILDCGSKLTSYTA